MGQEWFQKIHCGDFRNFAYFRRYRPFFDEKADFWGYWGKTKGCKMTNGLPMPTGSQFLHVMIFLVITRDEPDCFFFLVRPDPDSGSD